MKAERQGGRRRGDHPGKKPRAKALSRGCGWRDDQMVIDLRGFQTVESVALGVD